MDRERLRNGVMRRLLLGSLMVGALAGALIASLTWGAARSEASAAAQATPLPTNTPRATTPPTNTPRPSATPSSTPTGTATATPLPTQTPTATPSPTPTLVGPDDYPANFNPLTGLPYPNAEAAARRNLIVKVSNFPEIVRPQSGLDKADIVFEYEVEGGATRFAAIYRSQGTDFVGSIRSARLLDLELVMMFDGLLAYSGSNEWIRQYILDSDWKWRALSPHLGVNCPPFCRYPQDGKAFEHTLFGNTYQMWEVATERQVNEGLPGRGFAFSDTPDPGGAAAADIFIGSYNKRQDTRWQYNPSDGRYYRWNSSLPHLDAVTGKQLAADNIVVLAAEHIDRPDIYESETGGTVIETALWGSGDAYVFRDGRWYEGTWWHTRGRTGLWLTYPGGEESIHLKPGQTWIEVVRPYMWGVAVQAEPEKIYATQTQSAALTATAIAPYITPSPITGTPTPAGLP